MSLGRSFAITQTVCRLALVAGLVWGCATGPGAGMVVGQTPPTASVQLADQPDETPPLPAQESKRFAELKWRPKGGKYRIDTNRAIFQPRRDPKTGATVGGVEDDRPLASEKQNRDEAEAWGEVVVHADQFPAAELEQNAVSDLTPDDLTQPIRRHFRFELVRFDGTLTRLRRVAATRVLTDRGGPAVLYEGWLVPVDESPANPVRAVFTTLPEGFPAPPAPAAGEPAGEWLEANRWVTFAGYFFKLATYPGPGADPADPRGPGWLKAPVVVGKSVTPLAGPPAEAAGMALPSRYRVFRLVRDDAPISRDPGHWEEGAAWNRTVLHARKFDTAALGAAARTDVTFADLFQTGREDYQFKLVAVKGRLIRVKRMESSKRLAEAGVPYCYEAWVVPENEPRGNPVCVVLTELPDGVEPAPLMNRAVTVAGYFFKLFHYESAEPKKDDPTRHVWKAAPLLIGRGLTLAPDPGDGPAVWVRWFIPLVVGGVVLLAGTAVLLSRWFRAGDRRARAEYEAARVKNPFTD